MSVFCWVRRDEYRIGIEINFLRAEKSAAIRSLWNQLGGDRYTHRRYPGGHRRSDHDGDAHGHCRSHDPVAAAWTTVRRSAA